MARIRTIKPSFFTSLDMADHTRDVRLLFAGLWTHADDDGRFLDDARLIRAALFPLDEDVSVADVRAWIDALWKAGQLVRYTHGGRNYASIVAWHHQKVSHPTPSQLPSADDDASCLLWPTVTEDSCAAPEDSVSATGDLAPYREGNGIEGKGRDSAVGALPEPALSLVPDVVTPAAPAKAKTDRQRDALFDALVEACGMVYAEMTDNELRACGVARAQILRVGATADDVFVRARVYRAKMPNATLTPNALANNWGKLNPQSQPAQQAQLNKGSQAVINAARRRGLA